MFLGIFHIFENKIGNLNVAYISSYVNHNEICLLNKHRIYKYDISKDLKPKFILENNKIVCHEIKDKYIILSFLFERDKPKKIFIEINEDKGTMKYIQYVKPNLILFFEYTEKSQETTIYIIDCFNIDEKCDYVNSKYTLNKNKLDKFEVFIEEEIIYTFPVDSSTYVIDSNYYLFDVKNKKLNEYNHFSDYFSYSINYKNKFIIKLNNENMNCVDKNELIYLEDYDIISINHTKIINDLYDVNFNFIY